MRKISLVILLSFVLVCLPTNVFSEDLQWDASHINGFGDTLKYGLIGSGEAVLSNAILSVFNIYFAKASWAKPTAYSIKRNFTTPWDWPDGDRFLVNQAGHSYQGALYNTAGRVNGFGFYGSIFFSALGSFTWEVFGESLRAAGNDLAVTTFASLSLGEMLYRLYVEASVRGVPRPLTFLIDPMASFHHLVTGEKPPAAGKNIYQFQSFVGVGYARLHNTFSGDIKEKISFTSLFPEIGIKVIYGNPYEQDTWVPYRQFDLFLSVALNPGRYHELKLVSDGYLFSFSPVYSDTDKMSTGLSLQFDLVAEERMYKQKAAINNYSNALDWTIKYQHLFSDDMTINVKLHGGFTFLGASEHEYLSMARIFNLAYGINAKRSYCFEFDKRNSLELERLFYMMWTYPGTSPEPPGTVLSSYNYLTYSHFVTENISLCLTGSYILERSSFDDGHPDTHKTNKAVKLFAAWNL